MELKEIRVTFIAKAGPRARVQNTERECLRTKYLLRRVSGTKRQEVTEG
jgi:hypothetical protein